jgi:sigma-E factor negative regulatory protein RseC
MDHPQGTVVSIRQCAGDWRASIEVDAGVFCARCAAGKGCGAALPGRVAGRRHLDVSISLQHSIQAGDRVRLMLAPNHLLKAASWAYGLPLVTSLAATAMAFTANATDAVTGVAALLGLTAGLLLSYRRLRSNNCLRDLEPAVERVD